MLNRLPALLYINTFVIDNGEVLDHTDYFLGRGTPIDVLVVVPNQQIQIIYELLDLFLRTNGYEGVPIFHSFKFILYQNLTTPNSDPKK